MKLSFRENSIFFKFFIIRIYTFFKEVNYKWNIWSFAWANISIFATLAPLQFHSFLSYSNIIYLKIPYFDIVLSFLKNIYELKRKNLKKIWIFLIALFHIGVLCSKILDGLGRAKCTKFFKLWLFVILLTWIMGKVVVNINL